MPKTNENKKIYYITGNKYKLEHAKKFSGGFGIELTGKKLDIPEIQSKSVEEVALRKARDAWDLVKKPLVVSDSGWEIPALGGFPGPYMKDVNEWFTSEDFLNLMCDKSDRSVYLNHVMVAVKDGAPKVFTQKYCGTIIDEPHGEGLSLDRIVILDGMSGTIAQNQAKGSASTDDAPLWKSIEEYFNRG